MAHSGRGIAGCPRIGRRRMRSRATRAGRPGMVPSVVPNPARLRAGRTARTRQRRSRCREDRRVGKRVGEGQCMSSARRGTKRHPPSIVRSCGDITPGVGGRGPTAPGHAKGRATGKEQPAVLGAPPFGLWAYFSLPPPAFAPTPTRPQFNALKHWYLLPRPTPRLLSASACARLALPPDAAPATATERDKRLVPEDTPCCDSHRSSCC